MTIALTIVFIGAHLGSYLLWARDKSWAGTEKGIFAYHALSFAFLVLVGLTSLIISPEDETIAMVTGIWSLHAIYSMTFLEFWSLSQGSFSYAVLIRIRSGGPDNDQIVSELAALGASKKAGRIDGLAHLGLIRRSSNNAWRLTLWGQAASVIVRILLWLPATRDRG